MLNKGKRVLLLEGITLLHTKFKFIWQSHVNFFSKIIRRLQIFGV